MKKILMLAVLLFVLSALLVNMVGAGQTHVRGYYRSNGTYVQPHYRTTPDGNPYNNYSYPGNYNPNTGRTTPGNPSTYLDRYNGSSPNPLENTPSRGLSPFGQQDSD
jgi:hypothetical protein